MLLVVDMASQRRFSVKHLQQPTVGYYKITD